MQREHEKQGALFSCFYWAVYSWNMHETKKRQAEAPPMNHWHDVMVSVKFHACKALVQKTAADGSSRILGVCSPQETDYSRFGSV